MLGWLSAPCEGPGTLGGGLQGPLTKQHLLSRSVAVQISRQDAGKSFLLRRSVRMGERCFPAELTPTCCAAPFAAHMLSSAAMTAPSRGLLGGALAPAQTESPRFFPPARRELRPWQGFFLLARRKGLESHPLWVENLPLLQNFPVAEPSLLLQRCRLLHICVSVVWFVFFFLSVNSHEANLSRRCEVENPGKVKAHRRRAGKGAVGFCQGLPC